jgi:hypothetical protein
MKSIYSTFTGLYNTEGKPLDFLAMWKKTFDEASKQQAILFQKNYSDQWFDWSVPQMSLRADAVMGKYHLRVMATLVGDESGTPLRRSDGFDIWNEEIPRVGHKFFMSAKTYRKLQEVYKSPFLTESQKVQEIEKTLRNDMENAYMGCKDVADYMILYALSHFGVCQFTPAINNPGGRKYEVDYTMQAANKLMSALLWNTANSDAGKLDIILILSDIITTFKNMGVVFGEMLMSPELIAFIRRDLLIRKAIFGNDKSAQIASTSQLNALLADNSIPPITEITRRMGIEKDGEVTVSDPWNHNVIAFKPAGKIGHIQPAIEDSELMPEDNVNYIDAGNGIRISKWRTGDSTSQKAGEYTQGAARFLPIIDNINGCVCFQVRGFTEKTIPADADGVARNFVTTAEYDSISDTVEG